MVAKVFISYRREDAKWQAREIYRFLTQRLPREHVFMDVDNIPPGADFVAVLEGWVDQCSILLVLIGPNWLDAVDAKTGQRRLNNPNDFVRVEVREGLACGIPVVPVLIDGAQIPSAEELPHDLQSLVRRNAEFIELRTVEADVKRLMQRLRLEPEGGQAIRELTGTLVVTRPNQFIGAIRTYQLFVNELEIGRIGAGSAKEFKIPAGHIVLRAQLDWAKSEPLELDIAPGSKTLIEVKVAGIWKTSLLLTRVN
jgi:hypothetical protein